MLQDPNHHVSQLLQTLNVTLLSRYCLHVIPYGVTVYREVGGCMVSYLELNLHNNEDGVKMYPYIMECYTLNCRKSQSIKDTRRYRLASPACEHLLTLVNLAADRIQIGDQMRIV